MNPNQTNADRRNSALDPIAEEDSFEEELGLEELDNGGDYIDDNESQEAADEEADYSDVDEMEAIEYDEMAGENNKDGSDSDTETCSQMKAPAIVKCTEDDEFQRDFEKMLNESLTSRTQEVVRSNVEIVIPIERDSERKKKCTFEVNDDDAEEGMPFSMALKDANSKQAQNSFKFRVMARNAKSNKPLFKSIEVSSDSELVQNYLAREEEMRAEKEAVKKLILDINQRRELEDSSPSRSSVDNSSPRIYSGQQQQQAGSYRPSLGLTSNNTVNYHQYRRRFN